MTECERSYLTIARKAMWPPGKTIKRKKLSLRFCPPLFFSHCTRSGFQMFFLCYRPGKSFKSGMKSLWHTVLAKFRCILLAFLFLLFFIFSKKKIRGRSKTKRRWDAAEYINKPVDNLCLNFSLLIHFHCGKINYCRCLQRQHRTSERRGNYENDPQCRTLIGGVDMVSHPMI